MLLPPAPSVPEPPPFPDFVKLDEERKLNNIKSNFPFIERSFRCLFIQEKKISDLIPEEKVYCTEEIIKINEAGKRQERLMVLTDKSLYNIKAQLLFGPKIQRKFLYKDMIGISISKTSNEIVIHGKDIEHDYYYETRSEDNRNTLIAYISFFYCYETNNFLKICLTQNKSLVDYVTNKSDKKNNLNSKMNLKNEINSYTFLNEIMYKIAKKNVDYIFQAINKDYTIINKFCMQCGKDKNYEYPKINPEMDKYSEYKKKLVRNQFINDINNEEFTIFKKYFKEEKCPHFCHEKCKKKSVEEFMKKHDSQCPLCYHLITEKSFLIFGLINSDKEIFECFYSENYLIDKISYYLSELEYKYLPEVEDESVVDKFHQIFQLRKKFLKINYFRYRYKNTGLEISINNIGKFQNIYDEHVNAKSKDSDSDDDYHRRNNYKTNYNNNNNGYKKEEKVKLLSCYNCKEKCISCRGNTRVIAKQNHNMALNHVSNAMAHKSCAGDKSRCCYICGTKNGTHNFTLICYNCLKRYNSNVCFICNKKL